MKGNRSRMERAGADRRDGAEFLKVDDVAKILNVSPRTVGRVIKRGKLRAFQLDGPGTPVRVVRESVDRLVENEIMAYQRRHGGALNIKNERR